MAISELSSEEKIQLSKWYTELNEIVKQREDLDTKMIPLCDKLNELEDEENKLNKEYNEILLLNKDSFTSEYTKRLADITKRNVELSKEKEVVKQGMINLSDDFFNIRKEETSLREYIELITSRKENNIFSDDNGVVRLDNNGNVVDEIIVDSSNFSREILKEDENLNKEADTITKTSKKVRNVIKDNYKKFDKFKFNVDSKSNKKFVDLIQKMKSKFNELYNEVKKGYYEEEDRVQKILNNYNKIREENTKVEEEASNLKFFSKDNIVEKEQEPIVNNIVGENIADILPSDFKEEDLVQSVDLNEVVNVVDSNSVKDEYTAESKENKTDISMQNVSSESKEEFLDRNKIAKSDNNKKLNMLNLFEIGKKAAFTIGKYTASISSGKKTKDAKKEVLRAISEENSQELENISKKYKEEQSALEEQKQQLIKKAQDDYKIKKEEVLNIFESDSFNKLTGDKSLAA